MSGVESNDREGAPISQQMGETLLLRLTKLERELSAARRLNRLLGFGVAAALVLGIVAATGTGPGANDLEVRSIVLKDADGVTRGSWRVQDDGTASLMLHDRNELPRAKLSVLDQGEPGLALADGRGRSRVVVALLPGQGGTLAFADEQGSPRAVLGIASDDAPSLVLTDSEGVTRANLGILADGQPTLTLDRRSAPAPAAADTTGSESGR